MNARNEAQAMRSKDIEEFFKTVSKGNVYPLMLILILIV
jgi:Na+-transporting NADH:ubiquinone oxidoreductase subunit NqrD